MSRRWQSFNFPPHVLPIPAVGFAHIDHGIEFSCAIFIVPVPNSAGSDSASLIAVALAP